ncbi:MAG TPA: 30S ribosomal protein S18 [Fimbriimonas sp.]
MSEETTRPMRADGPAGADPRLGAARPDKDALEGGPRGRGKRRRKVSYLTANKIYKVDYKEVNILRRFLNDRGKILPSRQTGNTAKQQRMIAEQIRRAREMALLPFVVKEMGSDRREMGGRRPRPQAPAAPQQEPAAAPEAPATTE